MDTRISNGLAKAVLVAAVSGAGPLFSSVAIAAPGDGAVIITNDPVEKKPVIKSEALPPDPSRADQDPLAQKIQAALSKDTTLSEDAKKTLVEVDDGGKVTLRGTVDSSEERGRVENEALKIVGDGKVVNHLEIDDVTDDDAN